MPENGISWGCGAEPQPIESDPGLRSIMVELDWEHLLGLGSSRLTWHAGTVYHRHLTVNSGFTFPLSDQGR